MTTADLCIGKISLELHGGVNDDSFILFFFFIHYLFVGFLLCDRQYVVVLA